MADGRADVLFGANYPRLQKLKAKYDPNCVFSKWYPIQPSSARVVEGPLFESSNIIPACLWYSRYMWMRYLSFYGTARSKWSVREPRHQERRNILKTEVSGGTKRNYQYNYVNS